MNLSDDIILHGGHTENDPYRIITAGSLSMIYENGCVRSIRLGSDEVISMIYMAVRDRDWITVKPSITEETLTSEDSGFRISYLAHYKLDQIDFLASILIKGLNNTIELSFDGEALAGFSKNRIGFCVLHPVKDLAGRKCTIKHPGHRSEECTFPEMISPHQPFKDIEAMEWKSVSASCRLEFTGDIFETEDQRNWSEATFKTYSTPLSLAYPVKIEKGWKTSQKITFKVQPERIILNESRNISIDIDYSDLKPFPAIGICRSGRQKPLSENEKNILKKIRFAHYRTDLYLFRSDWAVNARLSLREAIDLNYPLSTALFFSENYHKEIENITSWLTNIEHPVASVMIFHKDSDHTPSCLINSAAEKIKRALPETSVLCGTNANFAQLNRNRPAHQCCEGLCWSVHPQEHASDNLTLAENIHGQGWTVRSARDFFKGSLWVSPVTLQRRFNANRENYEIPCHGSSIPSPIDSRIMSLFGAAWTAGSIKYLSGCGADAITYYETAGERGIIQGDNPPGWTEFPSEEGMIFPVYFIFRFLSEKKVKHLICSTSSVPLQADCLAFGSDTGLFAILFNLSPFSKEIILTLPRQTCRIRVLDRVMYRQAVYDNDWLNRSEPVLIRNGNINIPAFSLIFVEF